MLPPLPEECGCGGWFPVRVHREAACAIVQSLGRFMAAYFANQPLAVRPPHCVDLLDPLHFPQGELVYTHTSDTHTDTVFKLFHKHLMSVSSLPVSFSLWLALGSFIIGLATLHHSLPPPQSPQNRHTRQSAVSNHQSSYELAPPGTILSVTCHTAPP